MAHRSERTSQRPQKGISLLPVVFLVVGMLAAVMAVAVAPNKNKKKKEAAAQGAPAAATTETSPSSYNPFSDIDNSPGGAAGTRTSRTNRAPAGLLQSSDYLAACALAAEGIALVNEAEKARKVGDEDAFQRKGASGRAKLDVAFERVADWVLAIQDLYPNDRQVAKVERELQRWDRARKKVRKVSGVR